MERRLPEEILALIIQAISLPSAHQIAESRDCGQREAPNLHDQLLLERLATLSKLCRASKTLLRIAEPVLYRTFPGNWLVNTRLFVAALTSRPHRTALVQEIVIDEHIRWDATIYDGAGNLLPDRVKSRFDRDDGRAVCLEAIYLKKLDAFRQVVGSASLHGDLKVQVTKLMHGGHIDAVLSVLVLLCTGVQSIDLCCCKGFGQSQLQLSSVLPTIRQLRMGILGFEGNTNVTWQYRDQAHDLTARPSQAFSSLRKLSIRQDDWISDAGLFSEMSVLLQLPTLETVALRGLWITNGGSVLNRHPLPLLVRSVELNNCELSGRTLASLLDSCSSLTRLKMTSTFGDTFSNRLDIGDAFRASGSRLERLVLEAESNPCPFGETRPDGTRIRSSANIGGLRELSNLKTLAVTPWVILEVAMDDQRQKVSETQLKDVLPFGLKELTILGSLDDTVYPTLEPENIARLQSSTDFPHLKTVRFDSGDLYAARRVR